MSHLHKLLAVLVLAVTIFVTAFLMDRMHRPAMGDYAQKPATQKEIAAQMEKEKNTVPTAAPTETGADPGTETTVAEPAPEPERFVLTFAGDCAFGSNPNEYGAQVGFVKTVGDDYGYPLRNVLSYFEKDDATFINLEGTLVDEGYPVDQSSAIRGPQDFVKILTENSVEFASLANNHTHDYGGKGYDRTKATLETAGVSYVERDMSTMMTLESGLKIGVYGTVYYGLDKKDMASEIQVLRDQGAELVIVAAHWGQEGNYQVAKEQKDMGHAAIDAGADIVWGSHPHVLQPIEEYNGGVIYYSLSHLSYGGNTVLRDYDTAIVTQEVIRDAQGNISLGERTIVPLRASSADYGNNFQPVPYESGEKGYERVLQRLGG